MNFLFVAYELKKKPIAFIGIILVNSQMTE